jgi:hypothetical protein
MLLEQAIGRSSAVGSCHAPLDTWQDDTKSALLLQAGKPIEQPREFYESLCVPAEQLRTLAETTGVRGAIFSVSNMAPLDELLCSPARARAC